MNFTSSRARDAWATIRGYVYQVNITLISWLNLDKDGALELECGEDIDVVQRVLGTDNAEYLRILEQVKYRENKVTLRSVESLEALANFYDHLYANVQLSLQFRFITNAMYTVERPSPFVDKTPAITVWEQLRKNGIENETDSEKCMKILGILRYATKPDSLNDSVWTNWISFISSIDVNEFMRFINRFEWSTLNPNYDDIEPSVRVLIVQKGLASSPDEAERIYHRMFFKVFDLLSHSGMKRLTQEELQDLMTATSGEKESLLFFRIRSVMDQLEERISWLERAYKLQTESFVALERHVLDLSQQLDIDATIDLASWNMYLDVPPISNIASRRSRTVVGFVKELGNTTLLALCGPVACGKTYLAILMSSEVSCHSWIRFSGLSREEACIAMDAALIQISGIPRSSSITWQSWANDVCASLPEKATIVLDGLGQFVNNDSFDDRLKLFIKVCTKHEIKLISTSRTAPVDSHTTSVTIMQCPELSNGDILELAHRRDGQLPDKLLNVIETLTKGHPMLINALLDYLQENDWKLDETRLLGLLNRDYTDKLVDSVQGILLSVVQDEETRELLYRMSLKETLFNIEEVRRIATIVRPIDHPFEKFHVLIGTWIENHSKNLYSTSPLLAQIGERNLSAQAQREIHYEFAKIITSRPITPLDVWKAINHYIKADAFTECGILLLRALDEYERHGCGPNDWDLTKLWSSTALPPQMDYKLRVFLRAKQLIVAMKRNETKDYLANDLNELLARAPEDATFVCDITRLYVGSQMSLNDKFQAAEYIIESVYSLTKVHSYLLQEAPIDEALWIAVHGVTTPDMFDRWIGALENFSSLQIDRLFNSELAKRGCLLIADQLWEHESQKPESDRVWHNVILRLDRLAEVATRLKASILRVASIRAKIIVLGGYSKQLNEAKQLAEDTLQSTKLNSEETFLIKEAIGRQLFYGERYVDSFEWLTDALRTSIDEYQLELLHVNRLLSEISGQWNSQQAAYFSTNAVKIAEENEEDISSIVFVKALGDYVVSLVLNDEMESSYPYFIKIVQKLIDTRNPDDPQWCGLYMLFGHISGYVISVLLTGRPPDKDYSAPTRGVMFRNSRDYSSLFTPKKEYILLGHVGMFAEYMQEYEEASTWVLRAFDSARTSSVSNLALVGSTALPYLVAANRIDEAIDVAVDIEASVELFHRKSLGTDVLDLSQLSTKPSSAWDDIEERAAELSIVPMIISISRNCTLGQEIRASADTLITACEQMKVGASNKELWGRITEAVDNIFFSQKSFERLLSFGNQYATISRTLHLLYYLGSVLYATPEQAIQVHMRTIDHLVKRFPMPGVRTKILLPYFRDFWRRTFERNRFLFRAPGQFERQLTELSAEGNLHEIIQLVKFSVL